MEEAHFITLISSDPALKNTHYETVQHIKLAPVSTHIKKILAQLAATYRIGHDAVAL